MFLKSLAPDTVI